MVLVPDFFHGDGAKPDWIPADTDEKKQLLGKLFSGNAAIPKNAQSLQALAEAGKAQFPSVKKWGAYGLCWGGKVRACNHLFSSSSDIHAGGRCPFKLKQSLCMHCANPSWVGIFPECAEIYSR